MTANFFGWRIPRTPVNSRSSGVTTGLLKGLGDVVIAPGSWDGSYLKCLETAPHPIPGSEAATAAELESDGRRLGGFVLGKSLHIPFGGVWAVSLLCSVHTGICTNFAALW
jgi:hypothetical protein